MHAPHAAAAPAPASGPQGSLAAPRVAATPNFESCEKFFLDMGSNIGVHLRFLYHAAWYPGDMQDIMTRWLGGSRAEPFTRSGLCAIAFEANPEHVPRLTRLERLLRSEGYFVHVNAPVVVYDRDDRLLPFATDGPDVGAGVYNAWAARVVPPNASGVTATHVRSLDVARYLKAHVVARRARPVLAKMDIEGSEYRVLPHLEEQGLLCREGGITALTVEFHARYAVLPEERAAAMARHFLDRHRRVTWSGRPLPGGCTPTEIIDFDSEMYLWDAEHPLEELEAILRHGAPPWQATGGED